MMTIPYSWARVACPTCGAQSDTRCRVTFLGKHPGRTTDAHEARRRCALQGWRDALLREHPDAATDKHGRPIVGGAE